MSKKRKAARDIGLATVFCAFCGYLTHQSLSSQFSEDYAREYLIEQGYTNIQGGESLDDLNLCGNAVSRTFIVTDKAGNNNVEKTVCMKQFSTYEAP